MTGKKVDVSINTYLTVMKLKEAFMKAEQALTLTHITPNNHVAIEELKKEFSDKNREVQEIVTSVVKENLELKSKVSKMENLMMETLDGIRDLVHSIRVDDEELRKQATDKLEKSHAHSSNFLDN